jgi:putative membrane protein
MIPHFTDHAANERTFLAWVRTGLAVVAFGFVIERLNLFIATVADTSHSESDRRVWLHRLTTPLGHYDGLALIAVGIALMMIAAIRFARTARQIDDPKPCKVSDVRSQIALSAILALLAAAFSIYLVFA